MSDTANNLLHILRNPHGWSDDAVRAVRLAAADEIERLRKELEYAKLAAEAEARRVDELNAELDVLLRRVLDIFADDWDKANPVVNDEWAKLANELTDEIRGRLK